MSMQGFDGRQRTTTAGKVVYKSKKNFFRLSDLKRIYKSMDLEIKQQFIDYIIKLEDIKDEDELEGLRLILLDLFIDFLDNYFPEWVGNLVEWIYDNIDIRDSIPSDWILTPGIF